MSIQWRKVDLRYSVSEEGHVRNDKTGRQLNPVTTSNGYLQVSLRFSGKTVSEYVHRLVAKAFLQAKDGCDHVNHIDGNKLNNALDNLEWVSVLGNTLHAIDSRMTDPRTRHPAMAEIAQLDTEGKEVASFMSLHDAGRMTGIAWQNISKVCRGLRKSAGGFGWAYK